MKYPKGQLRAAAVRAKEGHLQAYRDNISKYYTQVAKSKAEWRERYGDQWIESLQALIDRLKEDDDAVIEYSDVISRDTGSIRRSDPKKEYLPPTWNDFDYATGKRIEKPAVLDPTKIPMDDLYDRLITICDLTVDEEVSDNALRNAGFSQADFSKLVRLVSRYGQPADAK